jgi:ABC-type glycerol-3-phosphate transport system substrate-binding protein
MKAMMKATMALLAAMLATTACNGDVDPQATAEPQDEQSVFDPMTDQIEKAKQVEEAALQRKADLDEAIEESGESTDDR